MSATAGAAPPRILRASPGRVRVHLAAWEGEHADRLRETVLALGGVRAVTPRASTRNVLVEYDPAATARDAILAQLERALQQLGNPPPAPRPTEPTAPHAQRAQPEPSRIGAFFRGVLPEPADQFGRARIAVRGIDRDPALARRVVAMLEARPNVRRAVASATTGRVLVEFSDRVTSIQDLLADISKIELPETPDEDIPAHPLDRGPIVQSGARAVGSALGLGAILVQRAFNVGGGGTVAATVAGAVGLLDGAPPVREGLRRALGRDRAQLLFGGAAVVSLALAGSPLGLLVTGAGALRTFTEARMRRDAWQEYEARLQHVSGAQPGETVRLDNGARVPLPGRVIDGAGVVMGSDGLPDGVGPGDILDPGATVLRGPLVVELGVGEPFDTSQRPAEPRPDVLQRYITLLGPAAVAYALVHAFVRRSPAAAFTGLLLVNPRAAVIGTDAADTGASARVLRAGATVVGTRPDRVVRLPDLLVIESPRTIVGGVEQRRVVPAPGHDRSEFSEMVAAVSAAVEGAWGAAPQPSSGRGAEDVRVDADGVSARVGTRRLRLEPPGDDELDRAEIDRALQAGEQPLVLREESTGEVLGVVHVRPRLAPGLDELRRCAERHGVELALLERDDRRASRAIAQRANLPLIIEADLAEFVRARQREGDRVAVLSDSVRAAEAFHACDLAIGLSSGRSSYFQARADLLAPGLPAVTAVLEAAGRRDAAVTRSVALSCAANLAGAIWGLQGEVGIARASSATYLGALGAIGWGWELLRGGQRSRSVISRLSDPRPERWGRMEAGAVLEAVGGRPSGLTDEEARARHVHRGRTGSRNAFVRAMASQLESPLAAVLGAGAAVSLAAGAVADVAIIGAVLVANAGVGAWQERQAGHAAQALERLGAASARVLRDGEVRELPAEEVVRGDILLLQSGDRVVADGRLLDADALELDEAALTGESLPVTKAPDAEAPSMRIVLEGSDVTVGTGRAVVVAVGDRTRLGATAAALSVEETRSSPLGERLDRLFRQGLPVVLAGGLIVTLAGIATGGAPLAQLVIGASVTVAAVPEGLPLLAGVAEASVARRLSARSAYVRRLASVESLGRVDVVCSDKTGTLTRGRLEVTALDDLRSTVEMDGDLPPSARDVLLCAAVASPPPDAADAGAHATDRAILTAAGRAELTDRLTGTRRAEAPFEPTRALHATLLDDRLCVKGAAEVVVPRCRSVAAPGGERRELDETGRAELLARAERLAEQGLRVLMVADRDGDADVEDPRDLTARGFVGISDPPRAGAADAIVRCRRAGIRVIMVTGDHPATAAAIAAQLGLPVDEDAVLTGDALQHLQNGALIERIERAVVLARITPIDKLRIVESLRAAGHTVAMTGDGVNDAPALRLADVGVAMGAGGTEVARQAADLVLADDRLETLTEALLEGRSLWQNLTRALGLLLGGNLGEVALMAGAAVAGRGGVLGARQILAINLITDVLPAVAVVVQPPHERELEQIGRETTSAFDRQLRQSIITRAIATAAPALAGVLLAPVLGAQATVVGFGSIIATQLAQTLRSGRVEDALSRPVLAAVGGSAAVLAASLLVPPLRAFLALPPANPASLGLVVASAPASLVVARLLGRNSALEQNPRRGLLVRGETPQHEQHAAQPRLHPVPSEVPAI